ALPYPADEGIGVEVLRGDRTAHRAVLADRERQPPRVDGLDADDAGGAELLGERPLGAPARSAAARLPDDEARDAEGFGLRVLVVRAVVALLRGGHRHDLARVRRIGEDLLV